MKLITEKHEIEALQSTLVPRMVNEWALLTAGEGDHWNTMTIAWGALGDMWWKPVIDVYVVPTRYTFGFMEEFDWFTVSFFPPEYRKDLQVLGSLSGRDGDKVAQTDLTHTPVEHGIGFEQADTTLICHKLYMQPTDPAAIPAEIMVSTYANMGTHTRFMGEIVKAIVK